MSTKIVRAQQPSALEGTAVFNIPDLDLITSFGVDTMHVVPGPIDVDRFANALSRALDSFPLFCGDLRRSLGEDEGWQILLNNAGVALTVEEAPELKPLSTIVQRPLEQLPGLDIARIISPHTSGDSGREPLMRMRVIQYPNCTAISFSTWHAIGDGCQTLRFLRSLSQLYQGLAPSDASPIYNIHLEDPPHSPVVETPCHQNAYPLGDHSPSLDVEEANQPVRLDFRFADSQLRQLRDGIHSGSGGAPLSRQDCLVALLALCFSLADPCAPIERVHTMLNTRGYGPVPANMAGNCLVWTSTPPKVIRSIAQLDELAHDVRQSILAGREWDYVAAWNGTARPIYRSLADKNHVLDVAPPPGSIVVNSSFRFDWTSAHFGYPGMARFFHTSPSFSRYIKIFRANPAQQPDGSWVDRSNDVECTLYIPRFARSAFQRIMQEAIEALGVTGDVEWIES